MFAELFSIFFNVKNNLKFGKNRVLIARGHVDATWRAGSHGSATRAHVSACAARR